MTRIQNICAVLGAVCTPIVSSLATFAPGPSYSVGIPSGSSISSTATGPIYIQLSAPTSYQWVAFGTGTGMAGATIFLMYADGNGNVTASVRSGRGHTLPTLDTTKQPGLTLLAGSGIVGGNMVANLLCTTCNLKSTSTATNSPFIAAWAEGSAINSASTSFAINQHPDTNTRVFTMDLTSAAISPNSNPFVSASTGSTSSAEASSGSSSTATGTSNGASPTSTGSSNSGVVVVSNGVSSKAPDYEKAHGIVMGVVVTLLFPLGAIGMRVGGNVMAHRAIQMISLIALIAGLGLGIKLAQIRDYLFKDMGTTHTIFGTIIVALFLLQPVFGTLHHANYVKHQTRTTVSHLHIWYGRAIMLLAVINGGLGLKLAANSKSGEIAYGVVAGVMGVGYILTVVLKRKAAGRSNGGINIEMRGKGSSGGSGELGSEELQPVVFKH